MIKALTRSLAYVYGITASFSYGGILGVKNDLVTTPWGTGFSDIRHTIHHANITLLYMSDNRPSYFRTNIASSPGYDGTDGRIDYSISLPDAPYPIWIVSKGDSFKCEINGSPAPNGCVGLYNGPIDLRNSILWNYANLSSGLSGAPLNTAGSLVPFEIRIPYKYDQTGTIDISGNVVNSRLEFAFQYPTTKMDSTGKYIIGSGKGIIETYITSYPRLPNNPYYRAEIIGPTNISTTGDWASELTFYAHPAYNATITFSGSYAGSLYGTLLDGNRWPLNKNETYTLKHYYNKIKWNEWVKWTLPINGTASKPGAASLTANLTVSHP